MTTPDSEGENTDQSDAAVECISAVTLTVRDMRRSLRFYRALRFDVRYGGETAPFTSLYAGAGYLNLTLQLGDQPPTRWGRIIFYVTDVDIFYAQALAAGLKPETPPRDAEWGERYFHIADPDGHELSFARPLDVTSD